MAQKNILSYASITGPLTYQTWFRYIIREYQFHAYVKQFKMRHRVSHQGNVEISALSGNSRLRYSLSGMQLLTYPRSQSVYEKFRSEGYPTEKKQRASVLKAHDFSDPLPLEARAGSSKSWPMFGAPCSGDKSNENWTIALPLPGQGGIYPLAHGTCHPRRTSTSPTLSGTNQ
jgi:hypothetical protein